MTCPCKPTNPENLREVVKCVEPTLFHKVERPASLGDDTATPPEDLDYKNVLLVYQANGHAYLYSSDGVPTFISYTKSDADISLLEEALHELQANLANEVLERSEADEKFAQELQDYAANVANLQTELEGVEANQFDLAQSVGALESTSVQRDTTVSADASTVTLTKSVGLLDGEATETAIPLPVADSTQAGVMNPATFNAVQQNAENIDSILGGAVVVDDLTSAPSQTELTESWKTATGKDVLINRASIYDTENKLVWYYYENAGEWKSMPAGDAAVSVSIATNDTPGIVKGSTEDGQVAVEADGSMSLNGYDGMQHDIDNLTQLVAGIEVPKVSLYTVGATSPNSRSIIDWYVAPKASDPVLRVRALNQTTGGYNIISQSSHYPVATNTVNGAMSAADKSKLDSLPAITEIGENLELTDEGVLNATGGSEYVLPTKIVGAAPATSVDKPIQITTHNNALNLEYGMRYTATGTLAQGWAFPLPEATDNVNGLMSATDKTKLDSLLEIKSLNDSLELDENGQLSVVGGGSSINLLSEYSATVGDNDTYNASYVNSRLNNGIVSIGRNANAFVVSDAFNSTIAIGYGAIAGNANDPTEATAIGRNSIASAEYSIAIGASTKANNTNSIAIGFGAATTRSEEVSIGTVTPPNGLIPATRYLANVTAGTLPTDAVNLQQMQDYVAEQVGDVATVLETLTTGAGV